ncbi:hypothetical protein FRB90_004244 [Tulasnella sp. 427]|nr:hypothetical protein FRB90_004244 [Tulasnella sp. 427]
MVASDKAYDVDPRRQDGDPSLASLFRAYVVYSLCSIPPLVDHSPAMLSFTGSIPGLKQVSEFMIRHTFFGQFVGGETAEDIVPLLDELRVQNKGAIFAYSVEVDESAPKGSQAQYRKNVEEMLHSIDVAADFEDKHSLGPRSALGRKTWVALKLTALVPSATALVHFSEHLIATRPKDNLVHYPGTPDPTDMDILSPHAIRPEGSPLTDEDISTLRTLKEDLERICTKAQERNITVIVDAEYTWYQPALDAFQLSLMRQFNRPPREKQSSLLSRSSTSSSLASSACQPMIYGTYQAYLRRNTMHLLRNLELARKEGFVLGVKLVRGAYHTQEATRPSPYEPDVTAIKGYLANQSTEGFPQQKPGPKPPVWDEKYETDAAYDAAASLLLDLVRRSDASVGVIFGTHNHGSCERILNGLVSRGLAKVKSRTDDGRIERLRIDDRVAERVLFGQLYGMCDSLTNYLASTVEASSPVVLKYVPYGKLSDVIPYLGRRAIENKSVLGAKEGGAADERQAAAQKIWKRTMAPITSLPQETILEIANWLNLDDFWALLLTCKSLYQFNESRTLWMDQGRRTCEQFNALSLLPRPLASLSLEELRSLVTRPYRFEHALLRNELRDIEPARMKLDCPPESWLMKVLVIPGGRWIVTVSREWDDDGIADHGGDNPPYVAIRLWRVPDLEIIPVSGVQEPIPCIAFWYLDSPPWQSEPKLDVAIGNGPMEILVFLTHQSSTVGDQGQLQAESTIEIFLIDLAAETPEFVFLEDLAIEGCVGPLRLRGTNVVAPLFTREDQAMAWVVWNWAIGEKHFIRGVEVPTEKHHFVTASKTETVLWNILGDCVEVHKLQSQSGHELIERHPLPPFERPNHIDRTIIARQFQNRLGHRVLGVVMNSYNHPDCVKITDDREGQSRVSSRGFRDGQDFDTRFCRPPHAHPLFHPPVELFTTVREHLMVLSSSGLKTARLMEDLDHLDSAQQERIPSIFPFSSADDEWLSSYPFICPFSGTVGSVGGYGEFFVWRFT